jgi:hypothetical protein
MDKMPRNEAPYFEHADGVTPDNSPIGYPNYQTGLSNINPEGYPKLDPPKRVYEYSKGRNSHSINPEAPPPVMHTKISMLRKMKMMK